MGRGTKVYINGPGHMTKMAAMPISGKSNRKAMNRNWSNQKANLALKTKTGKTLLLQIDKNTMRTNC